MNNYRHHVVNSIWSLKALDYYVISDEEIIEDAQFGDSFAPFTREMELDLCSSVAQAKTMLFPCLQLVHATNNLGCRIRRRAASCI